MANQNDNNQNYEEYCFMCHRPERVCGKLIHIQGMFGMGLCADCVQRTMDAMKSGNLPTMGGITLSKEDMDQAYREMLDSLPEDVRRQYVETGVIPREQVEPAQTPDAIDGEVVAEAVTEDPNNAGGTNGTQNPFGGPQFNIFGGFDDLQALLMGQQPEGKKVKKHAKGEKVEPIIDRKDIPAPHKIKGMLDEYVVGQEFAKKAISVAVYNHYKRVAAGELDVEIEKSNMLMIGPTGCGKTYLVKTLAKMLDVPLAIADATSLTEAGYIGDDIESVLSKLLAAADNDVDRAEQGIVFIDEIDKIAKKRNTNSRDVSGESVQQGLLKLLEGAEVEVPVGANSKNAMVPLTTMDTKNILFICGGAFPDLEEIIKERLNKDSSMGFKAELKDRYDQDKDILKNVTTEDLRQFGMIPEFLGRLPIVFAMDALTEDMMMHILTDPKNAIIKQYQKLLELDEVQLVFEEDALRAIARKAIAKDTGARALRAIIEEFMLDIMYEIPKDDNIGRVVITRDFVEKKGAPLIEMRQ